MTDNSKSTADPASVLMSTHTHHAKYRLDRVDPDLGYIQSKPSF